MKTIDPTRTMIQGEKLYDFECIECGRIAEDFALFDDRFRRCECRPQGSIMVRLMPLSASIQHFEPYYDESLDMDIHSSRHKKQVLQLLNLQESGDRQGGARNFDEKAPYVIDRSDQLSGRTIDDALREEDRRRIAASNFTVQTENEQGQLSAPTRVGDLKEPEKKRRKPRMPRKLRFEERQQRAVNKSTIITEGI